MHECLEERRPKIHLETLIDFVNNFEFDIAKCGCVGVISLELIVLEAR